MTSVEVDNGEWGKGNLFVRYDNPVDSELSDIRVKASDGHTYRGEMYFVSSPTARARIREYWSYAQRGGANWQGFVRIYDSVNWITCSGTANVCYEQDENPAQASITSQLFLRPHVWESLANDYLAGGWQATMRNGYYREIQNAVFRPIVDIEPPSEPCIAFRFVRVD